MASACETRAVGPWRLGCTLLKLTSPRCLGLLEDRLYHKLSSALALLTVCTLDRPPLGFPPPAPLLPSWLQSSPLSPLWTSLCSTLKSRRPRPLPQNTENPSSSCRLHLLSSFLFCLLFFFNLFIFGYAGSSWQHTGFLQLRRGGATLQLRCASLLRWLLLLWSPGSGCRGLTKLLQPVGSVVGLVGSRAQAQ